MFQLSMNCLYLLADPSCRHKLMKAMLQAKKSQHFSDLLHGFLALFLLSATMSFHCGNFLESQFYSEHALPEREKRKWRQNHEKPLKDLIRNDIVLLLECHWPKQAHKMMDIYIQTHRSVQWAAEGVQP